MSAQQPSNTSDEEFSAAATIAFDRPVPLLRGPIRAGPPDDPSSGPYVLAFRDPKSWANAYRSSESKILHQCEERERETEGCLVTEKEKCVGYAREKCLTPFRVCGVSKKQAEKIVGWGSVMGKVLIGLENCGFGVTNCKAGELVGCPLFSRSNTDCWKAQKSCSHY